MVGFGACFPAVAGPGLAEQPADDDDRLDQLPTPAEVVDSVFDFAAQLLNAQRELAHSVLGATTAVGESVHEEAEKAARTAKKSTKRR